MKLPVCLDLLESDTAELIPLVPVFGMKIDEISLMTALSSKAFMYSRSQLTMLLTTFRNAGFVNL
jgi:hypothetical protein